MLDTVDTSAWVLMDLERRPHGVGGGVRRAGDHAVDDIVVHQHGAEVGHVVHDLAGLLERDALLLAQLVAQLAGARVEHRGGGNVHAEFGCTRTRSSPRLGGV